MNVVKQAVLRHQQRVRLEGALWKMLVLVSGVSRTSGHAHVEARRVVQKHKGNIHGAYVKEKIRDL